MVKQQRISRSRKRELEEPDEFITFTTRMIIYGSEHSRKLIGALIAVIIISLGISGYQYYSFQTEKKAGLQLEEILARYGKVREGASAQEVFTTMKPDFENMLNDYSKKEAARIARMVFADIALQAGELDMALDLNKQLLNDFGRQAFYRDLVLKNIAHIYEQKGEYSEAIGHLQQILDTSSRELKAGVLFNLARLYAASDQKDKEVADYRKIIAEFPESEYARIARTKIN